MMEWAGGDRDGGRFFLVLQSHSLLKVHMPSLMPGQYIHVSHAGEDQAVAFVTGRVEGPPDGAALGCGQQHSPLVVHFDVVARRGRAEVHLQVEVSVGEVWQHS